MVLIQFVINSSTVGAQTPNRVAQVAYHALAGRDVLVRVLGLQTILSTGSTSDTYNLRVDFTGLAPIGRGILAPSGSSTFDEPGSSFGLCFTAFSAQGQTGGPIALSNPWSAPVAFNAVLGCGNTIGINVLPWNVLPGLAPSAALLANLMSFVLTIDIEPID